MNTDPLQAYRSSDVAHKIPAEADDRIRERMYAAFDIAEAGHDGHARPQVASVLIVSETEAQEMCVKPATSNEPVGPWRLRLQLAAAAVLLLVAGIGVAALWPGLQQVRTADSTGVGQTSTPPAPDVGALGDACRLYLPDLPDFAPPHAKLERTDDPTLPEAFLFLQSMIDGLEAELSDTAFEADPWAGIADSLSSTQQLLADQVLSFEAGQSNNVASTLPLVARELQQIADQLAALGVPECES